jgi:ribosomal protein L37E
VRDEQAEAVSCHRCGHSYHQHGPACAAYDTCQCRSFQWVDPAPSRDLLGYHRLPRSS